MRQETGMSMTGYVQFLARCRHDVFGSGGMGVPLHVGDVPGAALRKKPGDFRVILEVDDEESSTPETPSASAEK